MSSEREQIEATIKGLEAQRQLLGDSLVEAALVPLRSKLATMAPANVPTEQTLKQITILFIDIVGSTNLSQYLDPEELHSVMDPALAGYRDIVAQYGGRVLNYMGDGLLAAFGADGAREDDAERAVRAGLALVEKGRIQGESVHRRFGREGFNVRVGLHTGPVLLGGGVDAEGSIRGLAVNVAARMEQTANSGGLRISHDTYAQVGGLFEVEAQTPLLVKGVDEPIRSYLVTGARPRSFGIRTRGIEGVLTRMVGRDSELESLKQAFERLFTDRKLASVMVVAEAGLGKSRLLYEFESWTETRPETFCVFRGRATPHTQGQPFGLLRDILAWRFQIADDDSIEVARAKLEAGVVPLFLRDDGPDLAEGHAHLLGHLIGIEYRESRHIKGILTDPRQIRNRALHAAAQMFRRVSSSVSSPVVLLLDDLHWADNESLDFLNYLAEVNCDMAMLTLSFSRPTLFERRTDLPSTKSTHQRIDLARLDNTGSRMLANELLKKLPEVPAALRELVIGGAEGNPFYMEELVKMLIDQGAIENGLESWALNLDKLRSASIPATLTGVLQARLDGLPAMEREVLQEASVIGQEFWDQALFALDERAGRTLPALVQRDLVLPRAGDPRDGLREYSFKHQILHQVTYNTVLKRTRRELHGKLAHWLSKLSGLRANDFLGATADHYELAGDNANAAEYHARAAEYANTRFAHDILLTHVERALALLEQERPTIESDPAIPLASERNKLTLRWRLYKVREGALNLQGRRTEQRADIEMLEQLANEMDDDYLRAYSNLLRSGMAMRTADWAIQESAARRGAELAEQSGMGEVRLQCLRLVALALHSQRDWRAAQALAEDALTQARQLGLRSLEIDCLTALATIFGSAQGDWIGALEFDQQALTISREIANRRAEAVATTNIGAGWMNLGGLVESQRYLEEGSTLAQANGDRTMQCFTLFNLSRLAVWQGDDTRALSLAHAALNIAVAVEARNFEVSALVCLGDAELSLGRHAAAAAAFERAREGAQLINHLSQNEATAGLARVALSLGNVGDALRHVESLLVNLERGDALEVVHETLLELTCYKTLVRAGDARAVNWLERAHAHVQGAAVRIRDATLRQGFIANIPYHREIVETWSKAMTTKK